jgi:hypothetical protein
VFVGGLMVFVASSHLLTTHEEDAKVFGYCDINCFSFISHENKSEWFYLSSIIFKRQK